MLSNYAGFSKQEANLKLLIVNENSKLKLNILILI